MRAPEKVSLQEYADGTWSVEPYKFGTWNYVRADLYEQLRAENERLKARLKEEIMQSYDGLAPTRQARYRDAENYADAVLKAGAWGNE